MWTLLLTVALSPAVGQNPTSDDLGKMLEQEYQALVKKEPRPEIIREAASYFTSTRSWDYRRGLALLRQSRSPTAVPLILQQLRRPMSNNWAAGEYLTTLGVLTGEDISLLGQEPDAVDKLIRDWWVPKRAKLTTDLGKMSAPQTERVLFHLLNMVESDGDRDGIDRGDGEMNADRIGGRLSGVAGFQSAYQPPSWKETDLHPAMYKPLLRMCGYDADGKGVQANFPIRFAAVPLLAVLKNIGEAQELGQLVDDEKQSMALRWVCVMALSRAGEDVAVEKVLDLLKKEKRLEGRLTGLLLLSYLDPSPKLEQTLLNAMNDTNQHIRTAALYSLSAHPTPAALPNLEKMLQVNDKNTARSHRTVLGVIGKIGTAEAKKCLASYLELAVTENDQHRDVYYALSAFESAVGQRWIEAGAHNAAYYRDKAKQAIQWWKMQ